ncbi:MAG TPA: endonuclease III domain-containing protein [Phycisphaerae bacterium]|nr:endonuclease III domain-containing protein [Phycisphaerae bacterium]
MPQAPHKKPNDATISRTLLDYYAAMHDRFGDLNWWPAQSRLEIMVGAVLTQNTAWGNVKKAIASLDKHDLLNASRLHAAKPHGIAPLIRSAGYFNVKARRLWNLMDWFVVHHEALFEKLDSASTAALRAELLAVNGIGPETADSILLYALNRTVFVIDAYTRRVLIRHKLCPPKSSYEDLQDFMQRHLPADEKLYNEYHAQIVMVGKHFCKPTPRCGLCPLRGYLPQPIPKNWLKPE